MDKRIVQRSFSFAIANIKDMDIHNHSFKVTFSKQSTENSLQDCLDNLERKEEVKTAVISSPNPRFYPISLEKFIISILNKEL